MAEYWRIERAEWDKFSNVVHLRVVGYQSELTKEKKYLSVLDFNIEGDQMSRPEAYAWLKTQSEFENSEDI